MDDENVKDAQGYQISTTVSLPKLPQSAEEPIFQTPWPGVTYNLPIEKLRYTMLHRR